jgi:dihydroorotase
MGGDPLAPLQEVLANAAATGAALHVVHLNSSLDEDARIAMRIIRGMRDRGVDVTTESYPYTAGSTRLESALFDNYEGDYSQLQWTETGERLTKETFDEYRATGGWVIIHGRKESTNTWLVAQPDIMVASDGVPFVGDFSHPRSAGTFARVLGHYVRDVEALSLMSALQKMTLDPARRLMGQAPAMRRKGRVQQGMDADLTVFDPDLILDQATYSVPARTSLGITHVLVNGTFVVRDGELVEDAFPGEAIVSEFAD